MRASGGGMGQASSTGGTWTGKNGLIAAAVVALVIASLLAEGRSPICPCGTIRLWNGAVRSAENSQQLLDPYSLTHLVHGLLFYLVGWWTLRAWPWRTRLVAALAVEGAWEVLENSPLIIDRYRAVTTAWGYTGDSVLNSLGDMACMALGFVLARRLPVIPSILFGLGLELVALAVMRDNLTLNVLMLVWPVEAIRHWQGG